MSLFSFPSALVPVIDVFEKLGIRYCIGGSVASSAHGIARSTQDIDIVADLRLHHGRLLVDGLNQSFYIDFEMVQEAIERRSSFNLIHFESMTKIDIFALKPRPFDLQAFERMRSGRLDKSVEGREFLLASPEDIILNKLEWYRQGGEVSERQWTDVLGVLKVQSSSLDMAYLLEWATNLGVQDLLKRSLQEAGLPHHESP
ncbi:MAG: hypothetical protein L0312_16630 [Acidobacteria bacterium]|nr:hypothetical protein [Acidobacteriota bacterium]